MKQRDDVSQKNMSGKSFRDVAEERGVPVKSHMRKHFDAAQIAISNVACYNCNKGEYGDAVR